MGKKRYSPEQIIHKLREVEILVNKGATVGDPCGCEISFLGGGRIKYHIDEFLIICIQGDHVFADPGMVRHIE